MAGDTENELMNALTDEERAALGDEGIGDGLAPAAADEAEPTEAAAESEQTESQVPEIEAEPAQEINGPLRARAPENIDEALTVLAQNEESLAQRFDDGDITAKEYREEMARINQQRQQITWAQQKAELAAEMTEAAKREAWEREVSDFMTTGPGSALRASETQMIAFDNIVRRVTADPANASLSDRAQLHKAFRLFAEDMKRAYNIDLAGAQQQAAPQTQQAPARQTRAVVPTLAHVPAAEPESLDQGRFAALDRLSTADPIAYEQAVARMTDAERAQFEATL